MRPVVAILLLCLLLPATGAGVSAGADDCVPEVVEGVGPACRRPDGLLDVFGRDGRRIATTHGPDPIDDLPTVLAASRPPVCSEGRFQEKFVRVVYARAVDDADRYATMAPVLRSLVAQANGLVDEAVMRSSAGVHADIRVLCASGVVTVVNAVLPTPLSRTTFATISEDLLDQGYGGSEEKVWVWFDDRSPCSCAGMGELALDDLPGPGNLNMHITWFAVVFGVESVRPWLHELGHNFGAVQDSAPHATDAGHCWDGLDTMCYNDGGPQAWRYTTSVCSTEVFDCRNDDYCSGSPSALSYLGTHWNVCSKDNLFIKRSDDVRRNLVCPVTTRYIGCH